ncbi:MAG TPA: hypothetical protein DCY86_09725 [Bdellovibrionales bacterium]|nr:hypothetical protein [Bdellovibrionales bacterium]
MKYDGDFKTNDGRSGKYVYERSYEVKTLRLWCIITGIVYGGACWGYLVLPTTDMKHTFNKHAEIRLLELAKAQSVILYPENSNFLSWGEGAESEQVTLYGNAVTTPAPTNKPQPSNSVEFIR